MQKYLLSIIAVTSVLIFSIIGISFGWELVALGYLRETFDDNINSTVELPVNPITTVTNPIGTYITQQEERIRWDFITECMGGIGVHHEGKTQTLDVVGHLFGRIYSRNFLMSNVYEDISLLYTQVFIDRIFFQVTNVFQHYPEPDRYENRFGLTRERLNYYVNNGNCAGVFEITKHYSFSVGYSNQYLNNTYKHDWRSYYIRYSNFNLFNQTVLSSLMHLATTQHEVHWDSSNYSFIFYNYSWLQQFPSRGTSQTHTPGVGHRLNFTSQLYAECRLAPDIIIPYRDVLNNINRIQLLLNPLKPLNISVFANFSLVNEVDKKTTAGLVFTYRTEAADYTTDMVTHWQITGDLTRQVFTRLQLTTSIYYGQGYFELRKATTRLFGFAPSVAYEFTEHFSARIWYELTVNYTHVDGLKMLNGYVLNRNGYAAADSGYIRNRISIGISAEL